MLARTWRNLNFYYFIKFVYRVNTVYKQFINQKQIINIMATKDILRVWKLVFGNWKYTLSAIIVALGFYSLNVLIANYTNLVSFYSSLGPLGTVRFFFILALGFGALIKTHSFISLIIVSILFGMLLSLTVYKIKILKVEIKRINKIIIPI